MSYFGIPIRNGLPIGLGSVAPLASSTSSPFSPASFFANGEQGWWYDPSNFATLFQDSAGTTPVTAVEQPVGLQLDLSKGLVLGPDLVTNGDFSSSANWAITGGWSISGGFASLTSGGNLTQNALALLAQNKLVKITYTITSTFSGGGVAPFFQQTTPSAINVFGTYRTAVGTYTEYLQVPANATVFGFNSGSTSGSIDNISVKELPGNHRFQSTSANRPVVSARVNLFVGTATLATQSVTTRATTHTLTFTGAGSITLTGTALGVYTAGTYSVTTTAGTLTATVLGTVTQADLRETNVGVGLPAYQAVVTSTNYDSTGFPTYIKPNGSNQFMVTNSINFTATDKMTVWQGVRKLSDAAAAILIELSASTTSNTGVFAIQAPTGSNDRYGFNSKGTALATTFATGYTSPTTNVLTGIGDISGDVTTLRVNGAQVATSSTDQGTGNYGNHPAYFYARAGTSNFFNGNDYGSIARGAASTAAQITDGETYINSKTKAYTP
jgi:hypothetical protein